MIDDNVFKEKYILLIPAMLDAHFPILKYAFYSRNYHPVILENEENVIDTGLKYVNNDMCFPCILNTGQMIDALRSGKYDPSRTLLLMPTAGDACRGANYFAVVRRAVAGAGFDVKVMSLNLKGLEKDSMLKLNYRMVKRALLAAYYGDILMILLNQTRPYECVEGAANALRQKWIDIIADDLKRYRHMSIGHMIKNFDRIAEDFSLLARKDIKKQRVGIVGELYIKYCHMGNCDMIRFLEEHGCESHTNGLSWYAMYYMDSHMTGSADFESMMYRIGLKLFARIQNKMIAAIRKYGFYTMEGFEIMKKEAEGYVNPNDCIGDGWLIGAEAVGHVLHDCPKVVAIQPFGCMPNHVCGRGLYPSLQRKLPQGHIVSVDTDSGASRLNIYNRVSVLIHGSMKIGDNADK